MFNIFIVIWVFCFPLVKFSFQVPANTSNNHQRKIMKALDSSLGWLTGWLGWFIFLFANKIYFWRFLLCQKGLSNNWPNHQPIIHTDTGPKCLYRYEWKRRSELTYLNGFVKRKSRIFLGKRYTTMYIRVENFSNFFWINKTLKGCDVGHGKMSSGEKRISKLSLSLL